MLSSLKVVVCAGAVGVVVFSSYLYGFRQGENSEELKRMRAEVSVLQTTVRNYETKNREYLLAMAELRATESIARNDADRMRNRIDKIERRAKSAESRITVRCLRLEQEARRLLQEARGPIEYCRKVLQ